MKIFLIIPLQVYRLAISPLLGNNCRFYPSCSAYAEEAISRFGAMRGMYLATHRLLRCHPWAESGLDPVPEKFSFRALSRA